MQVVIEIPDYMYEVIKRDGSGAPKAIDDAIANGTPLPKGHGDLIDRSKIAFDYWSVDGHVCVWKQNIFNMPVVIPADKEDAYDK